MYCHNNRKYERTYKCQVRGHETEPNNNELLIVIAGGDELVQILIGHI